MFITLKTKSGKILKEEVDGNFSLVEAQRLYNNDMVEVLKVSNGGTRTNEEARLIIENEGVGYAVQHYISGDEFKDPKTAKLWNAADNALNKLLKHLKING
jgi:hypothetical protein